MEHLEENEKPCLYLVRHCPYMLSICARRVWSHAVAIGACCRLQVFEYLSTDLKKYMDRNGRGPAHPLPTELVKVGSLRYSLAA